HHPHPTTVPLPYTTLFRSSACAVTTATPRPVALERPLLPPMASGLPVTTAGTEYPLAIETVSMIHAIISGVVLTSGAGMSLSGPDRKSTRLNSSHLVISYA